MKRQRAIIFSVVFQVVIAFLILDFKFNPLMLQSNCLLAFGTSDKVEPSSVVDCIACQYFTSKNTEDSFIGYFQIFVPTNPEEQGPNLQRPFDSLQLSQKQLTSFSFLASIFTQSNCSYYECSAMHAMDDFKMSQKASIQLMKQHKIQKQKDIFFKEVNISSYQFNYPLGKIEEGDAIKLQSNSIAIKNGLESLIVRVRYLVNQHVEQDRAAGILVYQLQTGIHIRFILILLVLLSGDKILNIMAHFKVPIQILLLFIMSLGFISSGFAIIASSVAVYVTFAKLLNRSTYGIVNALVLVVFGFLMPFSFTAFIVTLYLILVISAKMINEFNWIQLGTFVGIINTVILMWVNQWQFYICISPVLLLAALAAAQQQINIQAPAPRYNLINIDEQQDVLHKINKQLS